MTVKPRHKPAPAPKGRNNTAQGNSLGNAAPDDQSPEGTGHKTGQELLGALLKQRQEDFDGRGKYVEPAEPAPMENAVLPQGWCWASVEQLSDGRRYSLSIGPFGSNLKVADYQDTGVPLVFVRNIRAEDFTILQKYVSEAKAQVLAAHTADGGDILITKMGDPPGDVALYPVGSPRAVITADCIKWRLSPKLPVAKFFVYAVRSKAVQSQILERTRGVAQKKVSLEAFRNVAIPLPPPDEQRRIVAEIEKQFTRLEAGVAALRRVQDNIKRYRAAVLAAACEGRLVPTESELARTEGRPFESGQQLLARILTERRQSWRGHGNYKEPDAADTSKLEPLSDGWEWATVAQLSTRVVDGTHHTPEYMPSGIAFISVKDIRDGIVHFDACKFISPQAHAELSKRCDVEFGDVLITKSGTIGRMAVVNSDRPFSLFVSVALIKPVRGIFDSKFLKISLEGYIASINLSQDIKGALLKNLHLEDLRVVALRLPPLAEQTRIVAEVERRLSVVEELEATVTTNLQRATRLRQSILQKAFTGELRC